MSSELPRAHQRQSHHRHGITEDESDTDVDDECFHGVKAHQLANFAATAMVTTTATSMAAMNFMS